MCWCRQLLVPEAGETDIPGIADARLAGWRVASPVADNPNAAADAGSDASGESNLEDEGPGCGDVVEVRPRFCNYHTKSFVLLTASLYCYPGSELGKGESSRIRAKTIPGRRDGKTHNHIYDRYRVRTKRALTHFATTTTFSR